MKVKTKLIQEIEATPEELMVELLDFLLFIKQRHQSESEQFRPDGLCKGEFVTPDDFDDPLPDEIIKEFET
jgi:hypothetical protein